MSNNSPPLSGIRVLEFAGLAPGPFAGLILADFGAAVLRVDRPHETAHTNRLPSPTADFLVRHKSSICVDIKHNSGVTFLKSLLPHVDVVIDPFRPGVLERLGLGPRDVMTQINPRLIVARMTGFRRDGKYKDMAGHDINYIAVSGVLSMLGRKGEAPYAPGNIIGDFAGGGAVCAMGVMLALISRNNTGRGQIVEANMVDGSAYLATMPRLSMKLPMWDDERGQNLLDGGAPYYGTYETKDKKFMSVGALEPHFFAELLRGLSLSESALPGRRDDKTKWPAMRALFATRFLTKTRDEWERIFDGTDACVTPVLSQAELEAQGFDHRPIVTLDETPAFAIANSHEAKRPSAEGQGSGVEGEGWIPTGLAPSQGGEEVLQAWTGWEKDRDFRVKAGALASIETKPKL